ncbi:hypothetical protein [Caballeronia sp.]|uniref:hypothetical protein n=1 Tax=Caballeronia sp. TaxID=1931223 RepID=UPI003C65B1ED
MYSSRWRQTWRADNTEIDTARSRTTRNSTTTTTCSLCACYDSFRVHLPDGEARYTVGIPNHQVNRRVICPKAASG